MSRGTCAHKGNAHEGKIADFWLKLLGDTPRKRLENHQEWNLCL